MISNTTYREMKDFNCKRHKIVADPIFPQGSTFEGCYLYFYQGSNVVWEKTLITNVPTKSNTKL